MPSKQAGWLTPLSFLVFATALRAPFFHVHNLNWDEYTFILIGQNVLDGNLPYSKLWDVKPPLAHFGFAVFAFIANGDFFLWRLLAAILLSINAYLVFVIAKQFCQTRFAYIAACCSLLFVTRTGAGMLTEHLALLPLTLALFINLQGQQFKHMLLTGICLSIALWIRLNLAVVPFILVLYLALQHIPKGHIKSLLLQYAALALGFMVVSISILLPFIISGTLQNVIDANIFAALAYANAKMTALEVFTAQISNAGVFFGLAYLLALVFIVQLFNNYQQKQWQLLVAYGVAIELSIILSGRSFDHYWVQLASILAITSAIGLQTIASKHKVWQGLVFVFMALFFIAALALSYLVADQLKKQDPTTKLQQLVEKHVPSNSSLYLTEHHILYWFTEYQPIRASVTHPSNISKSFLLPFIPLSKNNSSDELSALLNIDKPEYILSTEVPWYFDNKPKLVALWQQSLTNNYQRITSHKDIGLYKRIKD